MHMADQAGGAVRVGVENRGAIAHRLRGVAPHATQLAAAQHAQGGAGQQGLHAAGGTVMARAASVC